MIWLLLVPLLLGCSYLYLQHKLNYWKNRNVQQKKPNIIFGNLASLAFRAEPPGKYFSKFYAEFQGPYFGFYAFHKPWLVVKDPILIRRILVQDSHIFPNRYIVSDENIDPILSNSLFAIKTPEWKHLRTKLSVVFTSGRIKEMRGLIIKCSENLVEYTEAQLGKSTEVKEMAAKYTTNVITSCAFGINTNSFLHEQNQFRATGRRLFQNTILQALKTQSYFFAPILVKLFRFTFFDRGAMDFLKKAFNETICERESSKKKRNDLIDILIELKNAETKDDRFKFYGDRLVAQAASFFGAGQEAISSVIAFTLHELCINQSIQERLRKEIIDTTTKFNGLTYEAVLDMAYLQRVICETLRKYPLTPFLNRTCEEDYRIPETDLIIEKGTPILISQDGLHWDPKYFPNPEVYDPERFNPENKQALCNCVYLPFGDGPRNCIGDRFGLLASKLGIIQILRNFRIISSPDTRNPLVFGPAGLLQAMPGVFVTFKRLQEVEATTVE